MMDRSEATGFGVAIAGHLALLAVLAFGLSQAVKLPPKSDPIEVSLVDEVGLESASPEPTQSAAPAEAPQLGPPEDAAPAAEPEPVPAPPVAKPAPAPPPRPAPKAVPKRPTPQPQPKARPKPAPKAAPKAAQRPAPAARPKAKSGGAGKGETARGSRLGKDFLSGLGNDPKAKARSAPGAVMSASAMAGIQAAIRRQIQPCADRQVNPGPGANRISVKLNLRLNRDGSLSGRPRVVSTSGVNDENSRYEKRVSDLAIAAFTGCAPLRGLPEDLYATPKGGWSNFNMNYKLPG